jgi:RimJ/RimL family protein N-acetyltransferase
METIMHNPFLFGEKIYLRAIQPEDADCIALGENHPAPRETLFYAKPLSPQQIGERLTKQLSDPNAIFFTICSKDSDKAVGQTAFVRIDWVGRMATFYIVIAEKENWSKGYGGEATRLMVDYGFKTLNLNRIQLHVATANEKAVKAYQRAGFQIEGTLRQAMYHHGRYEDFYIMGILREEYATR